MLVVMLLILHIAFLLYVQPILQYTQKEENFLYSWGQFHRGVSLILPDKEKLSFLEKKTDFNEFLLPLDKQVRVKFDKINRESGVTRKYPSFMPQPHPNLSKKEYPYLFYADTQKTPVKFDYSSISEQNSYLVKHLIKGKIEANVFISPTGRVIWAHQTSCPPDVTLRFDMHEWLRNMVFSPQKSYHWKNIEIMLK